MFETYSERARRAIFFARYEASQFGSPYIETEHILLGVFRADHALTGQLLPQTSIDVVRKQIEQHSGTGPKTSTSVDLPLSSAGKRVLAYASEEAAALSHKYIGPGHLLLGLLREEHCSAAKILQENGLRLEVVREQMARPDFGPSKSMHDGAISMVTITSDPIGAEIYVDDKFLGHTPGQFPLTVGEWAVRLTKRGFELWERKLLVMPAAKQNLAVDLVTLPE